MPCALFCALRSSDLTIKELDKTANTLKVNAKRATHILVDFLPSSHGDRELTKLRRRQQAERQKAIGLISKTTTLHLYPAFSVHFFAVSAQLQREVT